MANPGADSNGCLLVSYARQESNLHVSNYPFNEFVARGDTGA